jgi:hypothetical protein
MGTEEGGGTNFCFSLSCLERVFGDDLQARLSHFRHNYFSDAPVTFISLLHRDFNIISQIYYWSISYSMGMYLDQILTLTYQDE